MVNRKFVNNCSSSTNSNSMEPTNTDTEEISVHVHHVPFKLEYDGPANVDSKFTSKSVELDTESKVLFNQFRGRPLQGQKLELPENYEGLVATDLGKSSSSSTGRSADSEVSLIKRSMSPFKDADAEYPQVLPLKSLD